MATFLSGFAVDYFASIGNSKGLLDAVQVGDQESESPGVRWSQAITEIAIVFEEDSIDDEWNLLSTSINGASLFYPFLAFKRRSQAPRQDHIINIIFVHPNDIVPPGFEKIETNIGGSHPGKFGTLGYIAVKRASLSPNAYISGERLISDLSIVIPDVEEWPDDYHLVEYLPETLEKDPETNIQIWFHCTEAVGLCDLRYLPQLVDRFPLEDRKNCPLPNNELPLFAFPTGLRLKYSHSEAKNFPLPTFFTFVFTNAEGGHLYAACLRFYEEISRDDVSRLGSIVFGESVNLDKLLPTTTLFCPKVVCVLSTHPFYRALRRYLRQLYSMSLSSLPCPIEYFISNLVHQVPIPMPGGRPFHYIQDSSLISSTSRCMASIVFQLSQTSGLPDIDLDFSGPLRCLSIENLLVVFTLLLRESKMIFLCVSNNMLTETMECLRYLLFPLKWTSTFISRLPDTLTGLFQALGGFMIGFPELDDPNADATDNLAEHHERNSHHADRLNMHNRSWMESLVQGTIIVSLSDNRIYQYDGQSAVMMSSMQKSNLINSIPAGPRMRLWGKLQKICNDYRLGPQKYSLGQFDSAFDFQNHPDEEFDGGAVNWDNFPTLEIRDSFLCLMIEILGNYHKHMILPPTEIIGDSYRTFQEEFAVTNYLAESSPGARNLLEKLVETQMFGYLLQRRQDGSDETILFFDQASALFNRLNMDSLVPPSKMMNHSQYNLSIPPSNDWPFPLCKLLFADVRHNCKKVSPQLAALMNSRNPASMISKATIKSASAANPTSPFSPHRMAAKLTPAKERELYHEELLACARALDFCDVRRAFAIEDTLLNVSEEKRFELETKQMQDFELNNRDHGPLVIPGPRAVKLPVDLMAQFRSGIANASIVEVEQTIERFSYDAGWPRLNFDVMNFANEQSGVINEAIPQIRAIRMYTCEKVSNDVHKLVRPVTERIPFYNCLQPPSRKQAFESIVRCDEEMLCTSAAIDVMCLSCLMLSLRVLSKTRPVNDVLQLLGLIGQMEEKGLLPLLDERVWRGILLACARTGGSLMRQVARVVFETMEAFQLPIDTLTFGQFYQSAMSTKMCASEVEKEDVLDGYLHLEEIGLTWYIQRRALMLTDQNQRNRGTGLNSLVSTPQSGSNSPLKSSNPLTSSWNLLRGTGNNSAAAGSNEKSPVPSAVKVVVNPSFSTRPTYAATLVAKQLSLCASPGVASKDLMLMGVPDQNFIIVHPVMREVLERSDSVDGYFSSTFARMEKLHQSSSAVSLRVQTSSLPSSPRPLDARSSTSSDSGISSASTDSMIAKMSMMGIMALSGGSQVGVPRKSLSDGSPRGAPASSAAASPAVSRGIFGMFTRTPPPPAGSSATPTAAATAQSNSSLSSNAINVASSIVKATASAAASAAAVVSPAKVTMTKQTLRRRSSRRRSSAKATGEKSSIELAAAGEGFSDDEEDSEGDDDPEDDVVEKIVSQGQAIESQSAIFVSNNKIAQDDITSASTALSSHFDEEGPVEHSVPVSNDSSGIELAGHVDKDIASLESPLPSIPKNHNGMKINCDEVSSSTSKIEETTPKAVRVTTQELHEISVRALRSFASQGTAMGIFSRTVCAQCGFSMLDEEALSALLMRDALIREDDMNPQKHDIQCAGCSSPIVPQLHLRAYRYIGGSVVSTLADSPSHEISSVDDVKKSNSPPALVVDWQFSVAYLSPSMVRGMIEDLIQVVGDLVLHGEWLAKTKPELFWNLVWFAARANVPTGYLPIGSRHANSLSCKLNSYGGEGKNGFAGHTQNVPVFVAWREAILKKLVMNHFCGEGNDGKLKIGDVFQLCSEEELAALARCVEESMDGSIAGMRRAMTDFCACRNAMLSVEAGSTAARQLYCGLLTLAQYFRKENLLGFTVDQAVDQQVPVFSKCFIDAVRCSLSPKDFKQMETTESDMLNSVPSKLTVVVRIGFNFLY